MRGLAARDAFRSALICKYFSHIKGKENSIGVLWLSLMLSHLLEGDVLVTYGCAMQGLRGQKKKKRKKPFW